MAEEQATQEVVAEKETPATQQEQAKYTDSQLNDLIAKNAAKEAAKMLRDAGIEPTGELKKDVEAFKAWKESTMSETEKLKAQLAEREGKEAETKKEADGIRAENEALKKGVPADKVDRVKKLVLSGVYEGESIAEKVEAVLAEFPEYAKGAVKDIGGKTGNQSIDENTRLLDLARKQAGLTSK